MRLYFRLLRVVEEKVFVSLLAANPGCGETHTQWDLPLSDGVGEGRMFKDDRPLPKILEPCAVWAAFEARAVAVIESLVSLKGEWKLDEMMVAA